MKKVYKFLASGMVLVSSVGFSGTLKKVDLDIGSFKHIMFNGVKPTKYTTSSDKKVKKLSASVDSSSSLLLIPFSSVNEINNIRFEWKGQPLAKVKSAAFEASKKGDDSPLRIGLLLHGKGRSIPFFAPSWIKLVSKVLKYPSSDLLYLFAGSKHSPNTSWVSPYTDSIKNYAVAGKQLENGWESVEFKASKPLKVVGIWIMSDGDNTKSKFTTLLRNLEYE